MKALSLSLCLATIAFVAAQSAPEMAGADPLAPSVGQDTYSWIKSVDYDQDMLKANMVTELDFRARLLAEWESALVVEDFHAEDSDACVGAKALLVNAINTAKAALEGTQLNPILGMALGFITSSLDTILKTIHDSLENASSGILVSVRLALSALETVLSIVKFIPLSEDIRPVMRIIGDVTPLIKTITACVIGTSKLSIEEDHCSGLADLYRLLVQDASKTSPALTLTESSLPELKRLAAGSLSVLDLMEKHAIAAVNEDLLATRPIFAADLLNQYREELLHVAEADEVKNYAQVSLGFVVGISNALEACLRVAADPIAAIDDLNDELEAQDRYDDEEGTEE